MSVCLLALQNPQKNTRLCLFARRSIYNGFNTIKILNSSRNYASGKGTSTAKVHTHDERPRLYHNRLFLDNRLFAALSQRADDAREEKCLSSSRSVLADRGLGLSYQRLKVCADYRGSGINLVPRMCFTLRGAHPCLTQPVIHRHG